MSGLDASVAGLVVQTDALALDHEIVEGWQHISGSPTTGIAELGSIGGTEFGVWELTAGVMEDIEVDEIFLVISGIATIEFLEGGPVGTPSVEVRAGSLVRLSAGMRTRWSVSTAALRKLYLVPRDTTAEHTQ